MTPARSDPAATAPTTAHIAVVGAPGSGQAQLLQALDAACQGLGIGVIDGHARLLAPPDHPRAAVDLWLLSSSATRGEVIETQLRLALIEQGLGYCVLSGPPEAQLQAALAAWQAHLRARRVGAQPPSRWRHVCGRCGDGDCERQLFDRLPQPR
jgi:hypothetical protein